MTTVHETPSPPGAVLHGISWKTYVALRNSPENYHVRMTYDEGELEIMSPSTLHEQYGRLLDWLILVWAEERDLAIINCGNVTCRRKDLKLGFEPDNCYYVANEGKIRKKRKLNLRTDPPPDLAIEIDVTRSSLGKLGLYEALGVPELWRYDGGSIEVYCLGDDGRYQRQTESRTFVGFPVTEAERILLQWCDDSTTALAKAFRRYVRENT